MLRTPLLLVLPILTSTSQVKGHVHLSEQGKSMSYPRECCGREDCSPVTKIERVGAGLWLYLADGTYHLIKPDDKRRPSDDANWHLCTRIDYEAQTKVVTCVFEPATN